MTGSMDDIRKKLSSESIKCKKISHVDRKAARKAVMSHWKEGKEIGSIYYCDNCKAFHLTKRKPGNRNFRFL